MRVDAPRNVARLRSESASAPRTDSSLIFRAAIMSAMAFYADILHKRRLPARRERELFYHDACLPRCCCAARHAAMLMPRLLIHAVYCFTRRGALI